MNVEISWEGYEVGFEGGESQYPVISVVWDDYVTEYPDEYIGKCIEAYERFDTPEEDYQWWQEFFRVQQEMQNVLESIAMSRNRQKL